MSRALRSLRGPKRSRLSFSIVSRKCAINVSALDALGARVRRLSTRLCQLNVARANELLEYLKIIWKRIVGVHVDDGTITCCTCDLSIAQLIHDVAVASCLWTPRVLRQPPTDTFQQISQLRRGDRHRSFHTVARSGRRPNETPALQPLRKQTRALAVMPQYLDQGATPTTEDEQMAIVRIALERLLHQQRQAIEALAHVRMAGRQPNLHATRHRDHRRCSAFARTVITALTSDASAGPVLLTREPFANSTSIVPGAGISVGAGSAAILTAANSAVGCRRTHSCRRHRYNWLG